MAQLTRVIDTKFGNDILSEGSSLRRHGNLPVESCSRSASKQTDTVKSSSGSDYMLSILNKERLQDSFEDEIVSFLRSTAYWGQDRSVSVVESHRIALLQCNGHCT